MPAAVIHAVVENDAGDLWVGTRDQGLFRSVEPMTESLLEAHARVGVHDETPVARPGLGLGSRQRVLFAGLRMQKYRELPSDPPEPERLQLRGPRADDDPVTLAHRPAEQAIADGAADEVGLHDRILAAMLPA